MCGKRVQDCNEMDGKMNERHCVWSEYLGRDPQAHSRTRASSVDKSSGGRTGRFLQLVKGEGWP